MADIAAVVSRQDTAASEQEPVYAKVAHDGGRTTQLWLITCDEGWRSSIVCEDMYERDADWLLGVARPASILAGMMSHTLMLLIWTAQAMFDVGVCVFGGLILLAGRDGAGSHRQ